MVDHIFIRYEDIFINDMIINIPELWQLVWITSIIIQYTFLLRNDINSLVVKSIEILDILLISN